MAEKAVQLRAACLAPSSGRVAKQSQMLTFPTRASCLALHQFLAAWSCGCTSVARLAGREREGQREGENCRGRQREGERERRTARTKLPICAQRAMHRGREGTPRERGGAPRETEGGREGGAARERLVDDRVASPIGKPPIELHTQGPVRALSTVICISTPTDVQSSQDLHYV